MKKLIVVLSIVIACIVILTTFNPVVGYFSSNNSNVRDSPLFIVRSQRVKNIRTSGPSSDYFGKNVPIDILLPSRNIIQVDTLDKLSNIDICEKIGNVDQQMLDKWQFVLSIANDNLEEINKIIREDNSELMEMVEKYQQLSDDELKQEFLNNLDKINIQDENLLQVSSQETENVETKNVTSGFICNITSGPFCQITSQPICQLTSQPICDFITFLPPCLTLMGLRCPSAGLKCNTPTTGTICLFLTKLGPILKAIVVILIIAIILLLPLIVLVSILNKDTCTNIREQITYMFNCTAPE